MSCLFVFSLAAYVCVNKNATSLASRVWEGRMNVCKTLETTYSSVAQQRYIDPERCTVSGYRPIHVPLCSLSLTLPLSSTHTNAPLPNKFCLAMCAWAQCDPLFCAAPHTCPSNWLHFRYDERCRHFSTLSSSAQFHCYFVRLLALLLLHHVLKLLSLHHALIAARSYAPSFHSGQYCSGSAFESEQLILLRLGALALANSSTHSFIRLFFHPKKRKRTDNVLENYFVNFFTRFSEVLLKKGFFCSVSSGFNHNFLWVFFLLSNSLAFHSASLASNKTLLNLFS